jgi:hypothetical protein
MSTVQSKWFSKLPAEGLVKKRLFEVGEGGEFLALDGFDALNLTFENFNVYDQTVLSCMA